MSLARPATMPDGRPNCKAKERHRRIICLSARPPWTPPPGRDGAPASGGGLHKPGRSAFGPAADETRAPHASRFAPLPLPGQPSLLGPLPL